MSTSTSKPIPIRLAQALGITLTSILAGFNLTMSIFMIPRLLESPAPLLLSQWTRFYNSAKKVVPPLTLVSSSAYFYLAYTLRSSATSSPLVGAGKTKFWAYIKAAVLSAGFAPYTAIFMANTNSKLLAKSEEVRGLGVDEKYVETKGETIHQLVDWWGVLNLGRAALLATSGVLGAWISLV